MDEIKPWQAVNRVIGDMRELNLQVERNANTLADLLTGNLCHVSVYKLAALKRALHIFNANKREWKP